MRFLAIVNLCVVFATLCWIVGQPFMGELFAYKSKALLFQTIMGNTDLLSKIDKEKALGLEEKFHRNRERFRQLSEEQKNHVKEQYRLLQERGNPSWLVKMQSSFQILLFDIPAFEQTWIVMSVLMSLLVLLRVEGCQEVVWLLPLITICYAFDNQMNGITPQIEADIAMFPSEQTLVSHYLNEPMSPYVSQQRDQLLKGWSYFLIREYLHEIPSNDSALFKSQLEEAEFAFNVARVEKINPQKLFNKAKTFCHKESKKVLCLYFGWNLLFAWYVARKFTNQKKIVGEDTPQLQQSNLLVPEN